MRLQLGACVDAVTRNTHDAHKAVPDKLAKLKEFKTGLVVVTALKIRRGFCMSCLQACRST